MIPYINIDVLQFSVIEIQFWGLMVALGFLIGSMGSVYFAKWRKFNVDHIYNILFWVIVWSMIGGRLGHVIFYDLSYFLENPIDVLKIWQGGLSSFGGFIAAFIFCLYYFKKNKLGFLETSDVLIFGLPLGLFIGRIGCAFIHDHPGVYTTFFLGVRYPDGVRHDHGVYLSLLGLFIFSVFLLMYFRFRDNYRKGIYLSIFLVIYGSTRFYLDFLRAWDGNFPDQRYHNLTFAQYGSLAFVILGVYTYLYGKKYVKQQ